MSENLPTMQVVAVVVVRFVRKNAVEIRASMRGNARCAIRRRLGNSGP